MCEIYKLWVENCIVRKLKQTKIVCVIGVICSNNRFKFNSLIIITVSVHSFLLLEFAFTFMVTMYVYLCTMVPVPLSQV